MGTSGVPVIRGCGGEAAWDCGKGEDNKATSALSFGGGPLERDGVGTDRISACWGEKDTSGFLTAVISPHLRQRTRIPFDPLNRRSSRRTRAWQDRHSTIIASLYPRSDPLFNRKGIRYA